MAEYSLRGIDVNLNHMPDMAQTLGDLEQKIAIAKAKLGEELREAAHGDLVDIEIEAVDESRHARLRSVGIEV